MYATLKNSKRIVVQNSTKTKYSSWIFFFLGIVLTIRNLLQELPNRNYADLEQLTPLLLPLRRIQCVLLPIVASTVRPFTTIS